MVIQIRDIAANAMFSQKLLDQRRMMALLIIELTLRNWTNRWFFSVCMAPLVYKLLNYIKKFLDAEPMRYGP